MNDSITVSREWFEKVMSLWNWDKLGCPFCGSTDYELVRDAKEGFTTRFGCASCNRWFNNPEAL